MAHGERSICSLTGSGTAEWQRQLKPGEHGTVRPLDLLGAIAEYEGVGTAPSNGALGAPLGGAPPGGALPGGAPAGAPATQAPSRRGQ